MENTQEIKNDDLNLKKDESNLARRMRQGLIWFSAWLAFMLAVEQAGAQGKLDPEGFKMGEILAHYPSLGKVLENFDKVFPGDPETKAYLENLVAKMGNQKEIIDAALTTTVMTLKDPKQQELTAMFGLQRIMETTGIPSTYSKMRTVETLDQVKLFSATYINILKKYLDKATKDAEKSAEELQESNKDIISNLKDFEKIIEDLSAKEIGKNQTLLDWLSKVKKIMLKKHYTPADHTAKLLQLVP